MERLYRTMQTDADGLPRVGRGARMLGVRVKGHHADVAPDVDGRVHPGNGGMSVTVDDPMAMPVARRPSWLAFGASEDPLFLLGVPSVLAPLSVRSDIGAHALVEPGHVLNLETFEAALTATRPHWRGEPKP